MSHVYVEASVIEVTAPAPKVLDFVHRREEFTAEVHEGALRTGTLLFVDLGDVTLVRAAWDLAHRRAVNATLTAAGAAALTLDEAVALVAAAEEALAEALSD
jgi:hypothetical protein